MPEQIRSVAVFILLGTTLPGLGQLPPEILVDRYQVEVEQLIAKKDYKAALELMNKIVALRAEHDFTVPAVFHYQYAEVALSAGSYRAAIDSVNKYLGTAGRDGGFYRKALELLVQAEQEEARRRPIRPEMVRIPGGRFRMGCISGLDCLDSEQPVHTVQVESFELGKYEVTFEEYDRFTTATDRETAADEGWGRGRRPVINVSWHDAVAYTRWLSQRTGKRYRLPTEAEWEYAARAGTATKYHFGNDPSRLCDYGNHSDASTGHRWANQTCSDGMGDRTARVGRYRANQFGLHDMHGNVSEWLQDCWNETYQGAPADGAAWQRGDCTQRVRRGGDFATVPQRLRSTNRACNSPSTRGNLVGFRVARTITP